MDEFTVDNLINDAINELADDDATKGAEALEELAQLWSSAGMSQEGFNDLRKHIINSAVRKTDAYFIKAKLEIHEQNLQQYRIGHVKRIITS